MQLGLRLWPCWPSIISTLCKEHGFGAVPTELMSQISNKTFSCTYTWRRWSQSIGQLPGTRIKKNNSSHSQCDLVRKNQRVNHRVGNNIGFHGLAQCTHSGDFQSWIIEVSLTWDEKGEGNIRPWAVLSGGNTEWDLGFITLSKKGT